VLGPNALGDFQIGVTDPDGIDFFKITPDGGQINPVCSSTTSTSQGALLPGDFPILVEVIDCGTPTENSTWSVEFDGTVTCVSGTCLPITDNNCDGMAANIFKKFPGDDTSNTFVVDGVDVEMVRWDKDMSATIEANEGWIIKGTGNKKVPLDDVVVGTDKDDLIKPGWGDDRVCARAGDDLVQGSWGEDRLFGEAGDDLLKGGWNNDFLDGGADTDEAQGGKNSDTCIAETVSSCEA